jgi:hypothetical protein
LLKKQNIVAPTGQDTVCKTAPTGDKNYLEEKEFKLQENNNYLKKDDDFSGMVLYHGMDGSFVNGWKLTRGKVTHTVNLPTDSNLELHLKLARICTTEEITEWVMVPKYNSYAGMPGSEAYTGTEWDIYATTYTITTCYDLDSDGGTGTGSGATPPAPGTTEPDVPGGYNPPKPQPCNCTNTCPDCGGCLDVSLLKSANADCPACSCPKIEYEEFKKNEKALCVLQKLIQTGTNDYNALVLSFLVSFSGNEPYHDIILDFPRFFKQVQFLGIKITENYPD